MIKEIVLPDLGEGIESATISEIPLGAGEHVKKDDVLLVLESDKASMEIPSDYDGKITEVLVEEGKDIVTGEPLFKIEIHLVTWFIVAKGLRCDCLFTGTIPFALSFSNLRTYVSTSIPPIFIFLNSII